MLESGRWEYTAEAENDGYVFEAPAAILRELIVGHPDYARYLELVTNRRSIREAICSKDLA